MDNATLRKVQLVQLEILKEVKRICEKHNIKYILAAGTLLGAVRHKGFIPWDDDLDIEMMREEYEKFLKVAPTELSDKYFLQTWENEIDYPNPFAKIRKNGTVFIEEAFEKTGMHQGIWVDIFPFDYYPEKKSKQKMTVFLIRALNATMLEKCCIGIDAMRLRKGEKIRAYIKRFPFKVYSHFVSKEKLISKYKKIIDKCNSSKTNNLIVYTFPQIIPNECLADLSEMIFEDEVFPVPKNYDVYLKITYGDYMTPPPENERENKHKILKVKL